MKGALYRLLEEYMLSTMQDSAHDREHIYRVLYTALDIARFEQGVDYDVLIGACLLHDIGRPEQFQNPLLCHAEVGAGKARDFLLRSGFGLEYAVRVADCVRSHRYRSRLAPESIEAKILFDADKVDVTGALGIARTLAYGAQEGEPFYTVLPDGRVSDGAGDQTPSFFQEYRFKLEGLYDRFYTRRGAQLAAGRRRAAGEFYRSMLHEARETYENGQARLRERVEKLDS